MLILSVLFSSMVMAQKPVLADLEFLKKAGIPILEKDELNGLGYAEITPAMELELSRVAHEAGKCGGFESLESQENPRAEALEAFAQLNQLNLKNWAARLTRGAPPSLSPRPEIQSALRNLEASRLRAWVEWLSSYPSRYNKLKDPNQHVVALVQKLEELTAQGPHRARVEKIDHKSTRQQSIRLTIPGTKRPDEVVVLGGHLDSISGFFGTGEAPGADDNASGSSNLLEALRVLLQQAPPERTIEFYWYAGEESGLLGSAEIAQQARDQGRKIIGVLQLDMTLFPGDGPFVIGNITDFTTTWLRDYLVAMNQTYLNIQLVDDRCGYACSDHASWYRKGFATLMPFEARSKTMNRLIHTPDDVISEKLNFDHSLVFSKIALVFAMDLGNSTYSGE